MNKRFVAHPLMALRLIKPFLFILVFPLIKGIVEYAQYRKTEGILLWEAVLVAILVIFALIRSKFFSVELGKGGLTVSNGLFLRTKSYIARDKMSSLHISRDILDLIFGSATCHINTEAGRKGSPDFVFKLSISNAQNLSKLLFGTEEKIETAFSPLKIALLAAATSSSFTGLLIGVPIVSRIGKLLDLALEQMLFDEINHVANRAGRYIPPIFGVITLILFIAYGFAVGLSFMKYINFKLFSDKTSIEVRSGFIRRKKTFFDKKGVNNICIERNPLTRLFGAASMYASVGGYGNKKGEKAVIVPCGRKSAVKDMLSFYFPHLECQNEGIRTKRGFSTFFRLILIPSVIILSAVGLSIASALILKYFDRLIIFLLITVICVALYYAEVCTVEYRIGRLSLGDNICAVGKRGFTVRELYCEKERVGVIRITQWPADRNFSTCQVRVTVRDEVGDRITVPCLGIDSVRKELAENFDIRCI